MDIYSGIQTVALHRDQHFGKVKSPIVLSKVGKAVSLQSFREF
jgi:hypothetical protein